jgi:hypothetical protein
MDCLQQGIAMNNQGVQLLKNGDAASSALVFSRAVKILRAFSEAANEWYAPDSSVNGKSVSRTISGDATARSRPMSFLFSDCTPCQEGIHCDDFFIHSSPLVLSNDPKIVLLDDVQDAVWSTSTVMIFNMALSWHMQAVTTGAALARFKASQLYDLVLSMLEQSHGDDDAYLALELLALNNRAHLLYEERDWEQGRICVEAMCALLMHTESLKLYIGLEETEELHLNALRLQTLATASAA